MKKFTKKKSKLTEFGVHIRWRGAEHATMGTVFDYEHKDVLDMYRGNKESLNTRCICCGVNYVMGLTQGRKGASNKKQLLECRECKIQASEADERLRAAEKEEEQRLQKAQQSIASKLAQDKRRSYNDIFKPRAVLRPIRQIATSDDDEESDADEDPEAESKLYLPPPKQLESLLSVPFDDKELFIATVKNYKHQRKQLENLAVQAKVQREKKKQMDIQAAEEARKQLKNESLIVMSLLRMKQATMRKVFSTWRNNIIFIRMLRRMISSTDSVLKSFNFDAWKRFIKIRRNERNHSVVSIQTRWRCFKAKQRVNELRIRAKSSVKIQGFARSITARNILFLARQHLFNQNSMVLQSLQRLVNNLIGRVFASWSNRIRLMKHVKTLARQSHQYLKEFIFDRWKSNLAITKRQNRIAALSTIQQAGRCFVAKMQLHRLKWRRDAPIKIQLMYRGRLARNAFRFKLRQRRMVKKKMKKAFSGVKAQRFHEWKTLIRQLKLLRDMTGRTQEQELRRRFRRWVNRRSSAIHVQRVFRGFQGRLIVSEMRFELLQDMMLNGSSSMAEKERLNFMLDTSYQSPLLYSKRRDLIRVKKLVLDFSNIQTGHGIVFKRQFKDEIRMSVHGEVSQLFLISKHGNYLVEMLSKDIEKEILRIQTKRKSNKELLLQEIKEWEQILKDFLGDGRLARLEEFRAYANAGKSFDIKITCEALVEETLSSWNEMYILKYITRWVFISWIIEGLLMKKGLRLHERLLVWNALKEKYDRAFLEDLVSSILKRMDSNKTRT